MDCSSPDSSVHGILQARKLVWVAISFSRGSSWPRDQTLVSCTAGRYSLLYNSVNYNYHLVHYLSSTYLSFIGSLYLLTIFFQFLLLLPSSLITTNLIFFHNWLNPYPKKSEKDLWKSYGFVKYSASLQVRNKHIYQIDINNCELF